MSRSPAHRVQKRIHVVIPMCVRLETIVLQRGGLSSGGFENTCKESFVCMYSFASCAVVSSSNNSDLSGDRSEYLARLGTACCVDVTGMLPPSPVALTSCLAGIRLCYSQSIDQIRFAFSGCAKPRLNYCQSSRRQYLANWATGLSNFNVRQGGAWYNRGCGCGRKQKQRTRQQLSCLCMGGMPESWRAAARSRRQQLDYLRWSPDEPLLQWGQKKGRVCGMSGIHTCTDTNSCRLHVTGTGQVNDSQDTHSVSTTCAVYEQAAVNRVGCVTHPTNDTQNRAEGIKSNQQIRGCTLHTSGRLPLGGKKKKTDSSLSHLLLDLRRLLIVQISLSY